VDEMLTDREKIGKWNDICMVKGWSKQGELQMWLHTNNVKFTLSGSVLTPSRLILKIATLDAAKGLIENTSGEVMATHVLSVYSGHIMFASSTIEAAFWKEVIERMSSEFDLFMRPDLIPANIRNILKYPENGDGETLV
jgi:hypothetical protein